MAVSLERSGGDGSYRHFGGESMGLKEPEAASGQITGVWQCCTKTNHQIRNTR